MTILKFNDQYNNFSGFAQIQGTLLNTPTWNADFQTFMGTMQCDEFEFQVEDEIKTIFAGNHTVSAKGPNGDKPGQFNAELHKEGNKVSFNITYSPEKGVLLTLAPINGIRGEKPVVGASRKVVVDNVSVTAAELEAA